MEHMKTNIKQIKGIDALTGKPITWFKTEKLSKNARRKAKRYNKGKLNNYTATAKATNKPPLEYYNYFDSHKICRSPETILIISGRQQPNRARPEKLTRLKVYIYILYIQRARQSVPYFKYALIFGDNKYD